MKVVLILEKVFGLSVKENLLGESEDGATDGQGTNQKLDNKLALVLRVDLNRFRL